MIRNIIKKISFGLSLGLSMDGISKSNIKYLISAKYYKITTKKTNKILPQNTILITKRFSSTGILYRRQNSYSILKNGSTNLNQALSNSMSSGGVYHDLLCTRVQTNLFNKYVIYGNTTSNGGIRIWPISQSVILSDSEVKCFYNFSELSSNPFDFLSESNKKILLNLVWKNYNDITNEYSKKIKIEENIEEKMKNKNEIPYEENENEKLITKLLSYTNPNRAIFGLPVLHLPQIKKIEKITWLSTEDKYKNLTTNLEKTKLEQQIEFENTKNKELCLKNNLTDKTNEF